MILKNYLKRALSKYHKLSPQQIRELLENVSAENLDLQTILDNMPQGIITCDTQFFPWYTNKNALLFLQIKHLKPSLAIWQQMPHPSLKEFLQHTLLQHSYGESEDVLINQRLISTSIAPLAKHGTIQGWMITMKDVTEQREKETVWHRNMGLARMSHMAAMVAHEIKNPLAAMSIHIQLMQKELQQQPQLLHIQEYVSIIKEELETLNQVATNFLLAARPSPMMLTQCDLTRLVHTVITLMSSALHEHHITLHSQLLDYPCLLLMDESAIKQVLINMLSNAIQAVPDITGMIHIIMYEDAQKVYIIIKDNGHGIDTEHQHQIFEPYFTTKTQGSGLGLSIVYKILQQHNGQISVQSHTTPPHTGTSFTITLPKPMSHLRQITATPHDGS